MMSINELWYYSRYIHGELEHRMVDSLLACASGIFATSCHYRDLMKSFKILSVNTNCKENIY